MSPARQFIIRENALNRSKPSILDPEKAVPSNLVPTLSAISIEQRAGTRRGATRPLLRIPPGDPLRLQFATNRFVLFRCRISFR
jgi:hypothetical protein